MPVSKKEISPCPIDAMLSVVDGRWKGTILWRLLDGPMRTSELRRSIPGITERMLIRHLTEYLVFETRKRRHLQTRSTQLPAFCAVFLWQFCANIEPRL